MKHKIQRYSKLLVVFGLLLFFNNCGEGFKSLRVDNSSTLATPPPITPTPVPGSPTPRPSTPTPTPIPPTPTPIPPTPTPIPPTATPISTPGPTPTVPPVSGKTVILNPSAGGACNEAFEQMAGTLVAGDLMIIKGGTYCQGARRSLSLNGNASNYITIMAAPGETVIFKQTASSQNNLEIDNSSYLVIRGIKFDGADSGVRIMKAHHIIIEDNEIYNTRNNAIPINSGNTDSIIVRRNHIHHTGRATDTEGEGVYGGCHTGTCQMTNSIIENNYIHDLFSDSSGGNDGIEIKVGSGGNIIRNNVIHTQTGNGYPCIFVYGKGSAPNIVEGNVCWNMGEGIVALSDAIVRNNIVINSGSGIASYSHQTVPSGRKDIVVTHNTIYNSELYLQWGGLPGMVLSNNAVYGPVNSNFGNAIVKNNYVTGSGVTVDNNRFFSGGTAANAFINAAAMNFFPKAGSPLIGNADPVYKANMDFNGRTRAAPYDVGAYETDSATANPGWTIQPGIKP